MSEFSTETMEADAIVALAIDRAKGVPVPSHPMVDEIYKLGFAAGAAWCLQTIKEAESDEPA